MNSVNGVNELVKPVNGSFEHGEPSPTAVNTVNTRQPEAEQGYTHEEELQVLLAYAQLCKTGVPVTRRALRDHLDWNNKWFSRVIKPVCDKHGIAVRES